MTKENVIMLWKHFKKMEEEGNSNYGPSLQSAIKTRGKLNRIEIEAARPWLLEEIEKPTPSPKEETKSKEKK